MPNKMDHKKVYDDTNQQLNKTLSVRQLCLGSLLAVITALLHGAPALLSSTGMLLSPLASLPIAIATLIHIPLGIITYIIAAILLIFFDLQETLIFFFTTGLLGILLGSFSLDFCKTVVLASLALSLGIHLLTYLIAIPGFKQLSNSIPFPLFSLLITAFSFLYSILWFYGVRFLITQLKKRKLNF